MPRLAVLNAQGEQVEDIELKEELFMSPVRKGAIYYTAVAQQANRRRGTASTRTRGQVRGGGRKPWPQKGTGRARHGSIRSPIWVGGGVTFGPSPRSYSLKVTRKVKKLALKSALTLKHQEQKLIVIDELHLKEPKTREIVKLLENLNVSTRALLITAASDHVVIKSSRNIPGVSTLTAYQLNVLDLLNHDYVIMTKEALRSVEEVFSR